MNTPATASLRSIPPSSASAFPLMEDQFVDMAFMARFTGLTDKWFYKLIQDGKFPRPVKFGRSSRWLKSEVETWMLERIQVSRSVMTQ